MLDRTYSEAGFAEGSWPLERLVGLAEGVVRPMDPVATARSLWAAWDGVIASHLGPANVELSDEEFEQVLNRARETIIPGSSSPPRSSGSPERAESPGSTARGS